METPAVSTPAASTPPPTRGAVESSPDSPTDVLNLDNIPSWNASSYEKQDILGEGSFGLVYKAQEKETGELVALKRVKQYTKDWLPKDATREITILRKLKHENVIKLKGIVWSPGCENDEQGKPVDNNYKQRMYIALEYMDHSLERLLKSRVGFRVPEIKCYMKQLLTGVYYCHGNHVIHRDIKGGNILLNNEGYLKLADFGLARTIPRNRNENVELTDDVVTLWYRPPELLLGDKTYGPAVDMWSVGCVFGELLLGKVVFPGFTKEEQLRKIFAICGTPDEVSWPGFSDLPLYEQYSFTMQSPVERRVREHFQ